MELSFDELKNLTAKFALTIRHWQFGNKALSYLVL